jgi:uncharacterized protein YegP (UPF0339 family)
MLKITVYEAKDGWRWHAKRSGRIVAESGEAYVKRSTCKRIISGLLEAIRMQRWILDVADAEKTTRSMPGKVAYSLRNNT